MHNRQFIILFALLVMLGLLVSGCGGNGTTSTSTLATTTNNNADLDLGEDWDRTPPRRINQPQSNTRAASTQRREPANQPASPQGGWTIVLGTFSGDEHAQQARTAQQHVSTNIPMLATARVHSTDRGSMVLFGHYPAADDPRAVHDLARVKEQTINNIPAFTRAFLTPTPRAAAQRRQEQPSQYDLMAVRQKHPNVDPLYTLQVGVWDDFGTGHISPAEIRRQSEAYAQQLRSRGLEAYVYHDDRQTQSLVTVGLFDRTAIDSTSGEFGPEIRALMRRFPAHLVNGEELQEPIDRRRPDRGTRVQRPFLVIVPRAN